MQNAFGLPTQTVYAIFGKLSMNMNHAEKNMLGTVFQRAALVGPLEDAIRVLKVHLYQDLTEEDEALLKLAHTISKPEVLGVAVQTLTEITQSPLSAQKDKVLASQVLNELYGEKDKIGDDKAMDKIILNLVK